MKYNILSFSISFIFTFFHTLDQIQKIFSVISSLSFIIAILTYYYKKEQDKTLIVLEQIAFFRDKIIPEWEILVNNVKVKLPDHIFTRVKLKERDLNVIRRKYSRNFKDQSSIFLNTNETDISKLVDEKFYNQHIPLLNMLEEFALRIEYFKTTDHQALRSLHGIFVSLLEKNGVILLYVKDINNSGNSVYERMLNLYDIWEPQTKRVDIFSNLKNYNFITEEQYLSLNTTRK